MVLVILGNFLYPQDYYIKDIYYVCVKGLDDTMLQTENLTYEKAETLYNSINEIGDKEVELFKESKNNNGWPSKMTTIVI